MDDPEFVNEEYLQYGDDGATFVRHCETCCRFVKANNPIKFKWLDGSLVDEPNAICSKCGPTKMIFLGFC